MSKEQTVDELNKVIKQILLLNDHLMNTRPSNEEELAAKYAGIKACMDSAQSLIQVLRVFTVR